MIVIATLTATVSLAGCSTIGPSSVRLSAEVGARISEMQALHGEAVRRFFDSERRRIETFLSDEWEPLFLRNFLAETGALDDLTSASSISESHQDQIRAAIAELLTDSGEQAQQATDAVVAALATSRRGEIQTVRSALAGFLPEDQARQTAARVLAVVGGEDPALIMIDFVTAAHELMNDRRQSLLEPLREQEIETMATLNSAYLVLGSAQATITGRLDAAARSAETRDDLLDSIAGREGFAASIRDRLQKVSKTVGRELDKLKQEIPASVN